MPFKTDISGEISSVFCNNAEFAEEVLLDGYYVPAVCEDLDLLSEITAESDRAGVHFEGMALHFNAFSVPVRYVPEKAVLFNDEKWFCLSSSVSMGMQTLKIYRERS